jgi:hypothetical protein
MCIFSSLEVSLKVNVDLLISTEQVSAAVWNPVRATGHPNRTFMVFLRYCRKVHVLDLH